MKVLSGGSFQDPQGVPVALGTLQLALSIDATVIGTGQVAPLVVNIPLDANGDVDGTPSIWGNDELSPEGTVYTAVVVDTNGARVYGPQIWSLAGTSPIDLDNLQALLAQDVIVNYPSAVLLNPSQAQTINNFCLNVPCMTVSGDLTVTGNLTVNGAGIPAFQVNGTPNADQELLNLVDSSGIDTSLNVVFIDQGSGEVQAFASPVYRGVQALSSGTANVGPLNPGFTSAADYTVVVTYDNAGLSTPGILSVAYTDGANFVIHSSSGTDASTVRWFVI